jgi:hypothetical protein
MGRSVSYPSDALVVTFNSPEYDCATCEDYRHLGKGRVPCDCSDDTSSLSAEDREDCGDCDGLGHVKCQDCGGYGQRSMNGDDFDQLIDDFRSHLKTLFPSVEDADDWIGREDHVLAENKLARFGMSEYCGLVAYWIVPKEGTGPRGEIYYSSDRDISALSEHWVRKASDRFVAAFGELTKVGSMSNGEGVYRRIDK